MIQISRVLSIEDEKNNVCFMRDAFRRLGLTSHLDTVPGGEQAVAGLKCRGPYVDRGKFPVPACVLLDMNQPISSVSDVQARLRKQPGFAALPVINGYILMPWPTRPWPHR